MRTKNEICNRGNEVRYGKNAENSNREKWYREDNFINRAMFPGQEVGRTHECELWKSGKGNWLLTHEVDFSKTMGEAITREEAKELLMRYATPIYEEMFGALPEA